MKIPFIILLFFSSSFFSYDLNTIPKTKAVWFEAKVFLNHQYALMVGFGRAKDYLCLFRASDYKNYSNLEVSGTPIGFKAILNNVDCSTVEPSTPWVFKSQQASTDSDLMMEMFNTTEVTDARAKLTLSEETSTANPYGILTLDYNYVLTPNSENLYNATFESKRLGNGDIEFKSSVWVDGAVISASTPLGTQCEFYSSNVVHTLNSGGVGSVTSMYFNVNGGGGVPRNYPDGTPLSVSTTNFAYDANFVLYKNINGISGVNTNDRCLSRSSSWSYIPAWFGYGIYDSNGDRVTGNPNITLSYTGPIQTKNNESWTGNITIQTGSSILMSYICKKVKDGTHWSGENVCPGTQFAGQLHFPVEIDGEIYENFPLLDIPDGTVLTDPNNGNEYYVKGLRPRKVQSEVALSNCSNLTIQPSMTTPDHTFFNYPTMTKPRSGAILVNEFSNNSSRDLYASGNLWIKNGDQDSDGILNYLDAYPTDASKSRDDDYDGIEDSDDNDITLFQQTWSKYLDKSLYSNYTK